MAFDQPSLEGTSPDTSYQASLWRRTPFWVRVGVLPLVAGFTGMTALLIGLRLAPLPDESLASPTQMEDADGYTFANWTIKGARSTNVPLYQVPKALQQATIAVEDDKFYHHYAFNPLSVGRAFLVDAEHGRIVEGGSTITQQLAKNLYLSQDRTIARKFREALYAIQLELHESKQTILNQYLNVVYYGHGAYGIGAAANLYFNKPPQNLSLAECAMLAGLPKGPSLYSPLDHLKLAKQRQHVVLNRMVTCGYITKAEADEAYAEPIHLATIHESIDRAPYFTTTVMSEVEHRFGVKPDAMDRGDISISTTLDSVLEQAAERSISSTLPKNSHIQAALVALDPHTGAIKAMVGGRDYRTSPYNRVFASRQPGSTFKAILYSTALQNGWTPAREINSEETTFLYDKSKEYTVHDYGDLYAHRPLTLREAIARSDNVYAVTTNLEVGPETVMATARKMGISSPLEPYPSLALGVFPVSPLEMATSYASLANGGFRITPYTVSEVRDARQGKLVQNTPAMQQALPPDVAFQVTDLMKSVLEPHGTGYGVHGYLHGPAAAKTGTTNTDAWMVGFTPSTVCAVWVGYDDNRPLSTSESHLAAPIWAKFMGTAQLRTKSSWFTPPSSLVPRTIDPASGKLATDTCGTTETDYFQKGTEPTESCPLHPATVHPSGRGHWLTKWLSKWI